MKAFFIFFQLILVVAAALLASKITAKAMKQAGVETDDT